MEKYVERMLIIAPSYHNEAHGKESNAPMSTMKSTLFFPLLNEELMPQCIPHRESPRRI